MIPGAVTSILHIPLDESGAGWESFAGELPEGERARTERFHFAADRLRFAKCRAILRRALGELLDQEPSSVALRIGEHGKPHLADSCDIEFNVSHTRGAGLIAIHHGAQIGVDVEHSKRLSDLDGVARRVFTEREKDELFALGETAKRRLFFRLWTAKEAFLKAIGSGFSLPPAEVEAYLPHGGGVGRFECGRVEAAAALRCTEIRLPGGGEFAAMLCAPEAACAFEMTSKP